MKLTNKFLSLLAIALLMASAVVYPQSKGDAKKFSKAPGNPACQYFDGFADNGDGTVTDPRNGLIWKRCSEGNEWDGSQCRGTAKELYWLDAMSAAKNSNYVGKNDWRLPTKDELVNVVGPAACEKGNAG
jgi:hypothetical protein